MNMENLTNNMRSMVSNGRNDEAGYDMSTIEMMNNANNPNNYMLNGTVLTNPHQQQQQQQHQHQQQQQQQNDYMGEMENYPVEMLSQMQLEQAMNNYNNTGSMINGTVQDPNESLYMQNMKSNIENNNNNNNNGYESYRNLSNYNNTQNTIQTNQIPMNLEDFNNNAMTYMNQNVVDMYPEEFLKNLPNANDTGMGNYTNGYQMQNGNFNPMMYNNFNNSSYPGLGYENNMNNPQMYMQGMNQKQTRNVPLSNISQLGTPGMTPSMVPQPQPTNNIRRVPALNKKKMKPKKFFPCC